MERGLQRARSALSIDPGDCDVSRRRYSRAEVIAVMLIGIAAGTQLHHCNAMTPHARAGDPPDVMP
jgi:hypothetical protein